MIENQCSVQLTHIYNLYFGHLEQLLHLAVCAYFLSLAFLVFAQLWKLHFCCSALSFHVFFFLSLFQLSFCVFFFLILCVLLLLFFCSHKDCSAPRRVLAIWFCLVQATAPAGSRARGTSIWDVCCRYTTGALHAA